jgi:hypothetical protein
LRDFQQFWHDFRILVLIQRDFAGDFETLRYFVGFLVILYREFWDKNLNFFAGFGNFSIHWDFWTVYEHFWNNTPRGFKLKYYMDSSISQSQNALLVKDKSYQLINPSKSDL